MMDAVGLPSGTLSFLLSDLEGSTALWEASPTFPTAGSCSGWRSTPPAKDGSLVHDVGIEA
jgi:hypothetical protein